LELAQLIQHCLEVADAGGDQPAHIGDDLAHRLLVLEQGVGVDDLLHALDDLGLAVDAVLPGQAERVSQVLASAILGPAWSDRPQPPLRWLTIQGTNPPDSKGPVKVEVLHLTSKRPNKPTRSAVTRP
jgi:hypothetical protein